MLEYIMEVGPESVWKIATTTAQARRLSFYLIECGFFFAKSNYYTKRSNSDMYLLFATLSGKGRLLYEGNEYILEKNTIMVISCDAFQHYATISEDPWVFKWLTFNGTSAAEYYKLINPNGINILKTADLLEYAEMIEETGKYYQHQELTSFLEVSGLIEQLLRKIITERIDGERSSHGGMERLRPVIDFINRHFEQKISIRTLSEMMHISRYYFINIFKSSLGVTPHEYLINLRVKKAKELLISTDLSLTEISDRTGFCDSKNLILNFKKSTAMTPRQYRTLSGRPDSSR